MKFGYRDRIILLIACVVIIFGVGFFVFIRPKYQELKKDEKALQKAEGEWTLKMNDFESIPDLQESITKRFNKASDISLNFTDEMDATELDQFLQEKFFNNTEKDNIKDDTSLISSLSVSDEGTSSIGFYYYTPSIVTYPLYEYADLDGSLKAAAAEKRKEADLFAAHSAQTVGAGQSTFTVRINRKDAMDFIDSVRKFAMDNKDAMIINSVSIAEYDFNGIPMERDDDGKIKGTRPEQIKEKFDAVKDEDLGYTNVTFSYTVFYMQEPQKPDLGPEYNADIWKGDGWRTWTKAE